MSSDTVQMKLLLFVYICIQTGFFDMQHYKR